MRPANVDPVAPIADATSVLRKPTDNSRPNADVMPASITTWIGTKMNASENGIGEAPAAAAAVAAVPTIP